MLSGAQIRNISDVAAYRAAEEGRKPLAIWHAGDIRHMPFLGRFVPAGYRVATWSDVKPSVDSTLAYGSRRDDAEVWAEVGGWGGDPSSFIVATGLHWAIVEAGEFQVYARAYVQDADAPEQGVPDIEPCEECGEVHNDIEECFGE